MSRISDLSSRDLCGNIFEPNPPGVGPYTDDELDVIIDYMREYRAKLKADNAARIARGWPPLRTLTVSQNEEIERRVEAKAAERAALKRDPRQLDLEEALAASAGDAE